jgi:hypothetical protein
MRFDPHLLGEHRYTEGPKYRFVTTAPVEIVLNQPLGFHSFADSEGNVWLTIIGNRLIVSARYATDGCSPKTRVFGLWIGTPDFLWTRLASCIHDACYQFLHIPCFPLTRIECDQLFYELMLHDIKRLKVRNAWWARQVAGGYRNAVMTAGAPFYAWGSLTKGRDGSCLIHNEEEA